LNGVKYYTIVQLPTNIAVWKQFEQYDGIPRQSNTTTWPLCVQLDAKEVLKTQPRLQGVLVVA
jgi:hypothetical protein